MISEFPFEFIRVGIIIHRRRTMIIISEFYLYLFHSSVRFTPFSLLFLLVALEKPLETRPKTFQTLCGEARDGVDKSG